MEKNRTFRSVGFADWFKKIRGSKNELVSENAVTGVH